MMIFKYNIMDLVDTIQTQGPEFSWHISVVQLVHLAVQLAAVCLKYIQYPAHSPGASSCSVHMAEGWQPFRCVTVFDQFTKKI